MEYTALYRKYRPRFFQDLVGQEHIARTLLNAVATGKIAHAYLFCGPRGTGKTSAAQIMSRAVNCLASEGGEPCGKCASCVQIADGSSLDILEIDAASNRGIDEIRDLRERVKYTPVQQRFKVYIIDEVHMLTTEAFNALLKTLEEPPGHVIFILATTEPHKVPVTVLSRCQRFDFHRVGQYDIAKHLAKLADLEKVSITQDALEMISQRAEGGLRDAVGLLDQCIIAAGEGQIDNPLITKVLGIVDEDFVGQMAQAVAKGDGSQIVKSVEILVAEGRDLRQFLQQLLEYVRQQLLLDLEKASAVINSRRALQMLRDLVEGDQRLRYSLTPRLTLEIALLTAARLEYAAAETAPEPTTPVAAKAAPEVKVEVKPAPKVVSVQPQDGGVPPKVWQEILQQTSRLSVVTNAYLKQAASQRIKDEKVLIIGFDSESKIHMTGINKPEHKEKVEKAVSRVYGKLMTVETEEV